MSVVEFSVGDKDYIDKLNEMSTQAGDVQQAKTDAENAVETSQAAAIQAEEARVNAQAVATGTLNYLEVSTHTELATGDRLSVVTPGTVLSLNAFLTTIQKGQWFTVINDSSGLIYVESLAGLSLVVTSSNGTVSITSGDRLVINVGNLRRFRATSLTTLEVR